MKILVKSMVLVSFLGLVSVVATAHPSIEGVGMAVGIDNNTVVVHQVFAGSPAERGGVHAGDIITAVDGKDVSGKSLKKVVHSIRGPAGTQVTITLSDGHEHLRDAHMIREKFELPESDR